MSQGTETLLNIDQVTIELLIGPHRITSVMGCDKCQDQSFKLDVFFSAVGSHHQCSVGKKVVVGRAVSHLANTATYRSAIQTGNERELPQAKRVRSLSE